MNNPIRIIVSDDSQMARSGLIALLQSFRTSSAQFAQFKIVGEASNGEEVIGLTRVLNPDVVFLDARMPVMNGIEATRIVKATMEGVKVIVMSMYPENRQPAYEAGADFFLEKGVGDVNMSEIIHNLLSDQS